MAFSKLSSVFFSAALISQSFLCSHDDATTYLVTNLVSNQHGEARETDPRLLNTWGLAFDCDQNLVVANNHSNSATSYARDGSILNFAISVNSAPTGLERNHHPDAFLLRKKGHPAEYLFCTEEGTILAFNSQVDPHNAVVVIDRSKFNAIYKGLAISTIGEQVYLYAADFYNGKVDVFDSEFNHAFSFTDHELPAGYAPFNVQRITGSIYVTFALQNEDKEDDVAGPGFGYVDVFSPSGHLERRLISRGHLNAPWGLAVVPDHFGCFEHALLVANFGDGLINAYCLNNGEFLGTLIDSNHGRPISIEGLWAIKFLPYIDIDCAHDHEVHHEIDYLYFTAGPNDEEDGLVGVITPHGHHDDD